MHPASTVDFASAARELTRAARGRGLVGPSFRCPPRLVGVDRSIRRRADGATVAVRLRGRPWPAVLADMIEGVVATNELGSPQADRLRAELWAALGVESSGGESLGVESFGIEPFGSGAHTDAQPPGRSEGNDRADHQGITTRVA